MNMKKGFTLVELLIVMVIVALLVTVALPQYKLAMEKGRGLEAIHNVQAMSDAVNAEYIKNGNQYPTTIPQKPSLANITAEKMFTVKAKKGLNGTVEVTAVRQNGPSYSITFTSKDGEVTGRSCSGEIKYCKSLGIPHDGKNTLAVDLDPK